MLILHGDDYVSSRNELQRLRDQATKQALEIILFDGQKLLLVDLRQAVESISLFGNQRLVIIEHLFGGPKSVRQTQVLDYLKETLPKTVVIWEGKALTSATLKRFTGAKAQEFKPKTIIFEFLEALVPNNTKQIINLYTQIQTTQPVELVFFLVCRQVRLLLQATSDPRSLSGPGWLTGKTLRQAKAFTTHKLLDLHAGLYEIDKGLKTGASPLPLAAALELWLASL